MKPSSISSSFYLADDNFTSNKKLTTKAANQADLRFIKPVESQNSSVVDEEPISESNDN